MAGRFIFVEDEDEDDFQEDHHEENKIISIKVPYQNGKVILMNHPASLYLYKYVSVSVLSGTVSINGYEMQYPQSFNAFSSEKTDLVEVKTESYETIWKKKTLETMLHQTLFLILGSVETCQKVYDQMGFSTVLLFVKRCPLPPAIRFAQLYHPRAFSYHLHNNEATKDTIWFADNKTPSVRFSHEVEEVACKIAALIRNAKLINANYPRILVYGPRNSGKSTLLKYLVNKMLAQFGSVCYLDTDPGQPEFTPPGVVSLTRVINPVLGPSFFHQKKDTKMIFVGDVSPSLHDMYNDGIYSLKEIYDNDFKHETLFVNTMGWVEGTGLQCLINTIHSVKPSVLIEIAVPHAATMFDYRSYVSEDTQYFQIPCKHEIMRKTLTAREIRELCLLSHFGRLQPFYTTPMPINQFTPFCVSWEKIAILIFPERNIPINRTAQVLNGSIVALCSVSEDCIVKTKNEDFPLTLVSEPDNECLAYGFVTAVDETYHKLYIISPLEKKELKKVNAIMKGNIMVPQDLILKQEVYDVPLLYSNVRIKKIEEKPRDISMLSVNYSSDSGTETPESKPSGYKTPESRPSGSKRFPSTEGFRKPAAKRFSHAFKRRSMK